MKSVFNYRKLLIINLLLAICFACGSYAAADTGEPPCFKYFSFKILSTNNQMQIDAILQLDEEGFQELVALYPSLNDNKTIQKLLDTKLIDAATLSTLGRDVRGVDNPLFSMCRGYLAVWLAFEKEYTGSNDVKIKYYLPKGECIQTQTISKDLLDSVRKLYDDGFSRDEIERLVVMKSAMDAGVYKDRERIPYELDYVSTMVKINISDTEYSYFCEIPDFVFDILSAEDLEELRDTMCDTLRDYISATSFMRLKGSEYFDFKLKYTYVSDNDNDDEFLSIVYYPLTDKRELIPLSPSVKQKLASRDAE